MQLCRIFTHILVGVCSSSWCCTPSSPSLVGLTAGGFMLVPAVCGITASLQRLESFTGRNTRLLMVSSSSSLQDPLRVILIFLLMCLYSFFFLRCSAAPYNIWICCICCFVLMGGTMSLFSLLPLKPDTSSSRLHFLTDHGWAVYEHGVSAPCSISILHYLHSSALCLVSPHPEAAVVLPDLCSFALPRGAKALVPSYAE